ncbi:MAG: helix-turn-helix transcriptional regulator [Candidatus Moranbacteria bacterium]|nr:helix-turn-helix transcriptional regulator [Candidatus Moranbacteria bacterium]
MEKQDTKYKLIGAKIKEARDGAKMSQKDLAEALGYESGTAISFIEAGERKVAVTDLEKVAEVLRKDIKFFLGQKVETADFKFALRADKDLMKEDQEKILDFIDFVKKRRNGKRSE